MSHRVDGTKTLAFPPQRGNICAGIHMRVNRSTHKGRIRHDRSESPSTPGRGRRCRLPRPPCRHCGIDRRCRGAGIGAQAPGFYRYKVGAYECTSINDGARTFPMPDTFVKKSPKEEALAAAEAAYMPKGMVTVPFNPQLINTGSKLILIDCGNGVASSGANQGRGRPHAAKSRRRRRRSQEHRHRADVASASRSHQRHPRRSTARWRSPMPKSWCRRRIGNSG